MTEPDFDPAAILEALDRHHVDYILVGGYAGYDDLVGHAQRHVIAGLAIPGVAALTDIIASKTEAGRPKDLLALPELRSLAAAASPLKPGSTRVWEVVAHRYRSVVDGRLPRIRVVRVGCRCTGARWGWW